MTFLQIFFFISISLPILTNANEEIQDLIELNNIIKCSRQPQNALQLQMCATPKQAEMAKTDVQNVYDCQKAATSGVCNSTTTRSNLECGWVQFTTRHTSEFGNGTCLLKDIALQAGVIMDVVLERTSKNMKKHQVTLPKGYLQADCLLQSWNKTACESAVDTSGTHCGYCDEIDQNFYGWSPRTSGICFQSSFDDKLCQLLKDIPKAEESKTEDSETDDDGTSDETDGYGTSDSETRKSKMTDDSERNDSKRNVSEKSESVLTLSNSTTSTSKTTSDSVPYQICFTSNFICITILLTLFYRTQ